jgi:hypothetical protein
MRMIRDNTHRFAERPFYESAEIDAECERIVIGFLQSRGGVRWPVSTDDLLRLLEQNVSDLDLYADLSELGSNVEGVTDFSPPNPPRVRISKDLASSQRQENRLRTTITHELGHVKFHDFLFQLAADNRDLFQVSRGTAKVKTAADPSQQCRRETIIDSSERDWMEWQAGYACGAFLMPRSVVTQVVVGFRREHDLLSDIEASTEIGVRLISRVTEQFGVSADAARVRLLKLNVLTASLHTSIFDGYPK